VTIFAVSDLFNEFPEAFNMMSKKDDEVGSHSDDHEIMQDFSLYENFKRLQKSRLDIEQLFHEEVVGFRPPEERFDLETLNVLSQNKFSYIFAGQSFLRYAPVILNDNDLVFYPRIVSDDFAISKKPLLSTAKKVSDLMSDELGKVEVFGGSYLFSMHTHIFGEHKFYQEGMDNFYKHLVKQDSWTTNFKKMTAWWVSRSKLSVKIDKSSGLYILVTNHGDNSINDVVVKVKINKRDLKRLPASSNKNKNVVSLSINQLEAGKTIRIPIID
jgi:hypothetical protein